MLGSTYELEYPAKKGQYSLELPIDDKWERSDSRVLLVFETVDSQDLREGKLLAARSRIIVENLLSYSLAQVKKHGHPRGHAFAALNFNNIKFMDQDRKLWPAFRTKFAKRTVAAIEQLDPTHIIIFGDRAAATLLPEIENLEMKRGWVHRVKIGGKKRLVTTSLDLENLYVKKKSERVQEASDDDDDEDEGDRDAFGKANLLFYVARNVTNNLCGQNLFDLSHVKPSYRYVDTMAKFEELFTKLMSSKRVSVDTETANLSSTCNAIGTIQFATSAKRGYVLPIDHEQTPFSEEERAHIKKQLRKFFYAKPGKLPLKYLITQYGMFDLRVIREELDIPIIFHPVWEITAGEWCFHPDTLVETEHGRMRILDIVQSKADTRVWSFNHATGQRELKRLLNKVEIPTPERMMELEYEGGTVRLTENHKVWSVSRGEYVRLKDVLPGEQLQILDGLVS